MLVPSEIKSTKTGAEQLRRVLLRCEGGLLGAHLEEKRAACFTHTQHGCYLSEKLPSYENILHFGEALAFKAVVIWSQSKEASVPEASPARPPETDLPLKSFPKPMEEVTVWLLLLDFSFMTSSSLVASSSFPSFFFFFFFFWRGGSFLGKANMGKMTSSMATAHSKKPLHLRRRERRAQGVFVKHFASSYCQKEKSYQLPTKRGSLWSMLTTVLGST